VNGTLQHKERLLRKVKMNNDGGATISWMDVYFDPESSTYVQNDEDRTSDAHVHQDFKDAMKPFEEHWGLRCDQFPKVKGNYNFDRSIKGLEKVSVISVTLSGGVKDHDSGEEQTPMAAHITCTRKLEDGGVVNFVSPGIKLEAPNEKYRFQAKLDQHLSALEREVWAYLEGKITPPEQTSLFSEQDREEGGEADPVIAQIGAGEEADEVDEDEQRMERANSAPVSAEDEE